jgi:hypothetical protein
VVQEHETTQLHLIPVLHECLFDHLLAMVVAWEVFYDDFLAHEVLQVEVHSEDGHHHMLRGGRVKAEEQLTSI